MRIGGEAFFLMNGWMNYLALLLACRLARGRFPPVRALMAAMLGAAYAFPAALQGRWLAGFSGLAFSAAAMGMAAWGKRGYRLAPMIFAGGLLLSGTADFLMAQGASPLWSLAGASAGAIIVSRLLFLRTPGQWGKYRLFICWQGRRQRLPAIRDSGNLMRDRVTGLPVIVAPLCLGGNLLSAPWQKPGDGIPGGCRLLPVHTAAGRKLALCLHPDQITLCRGRKHWMADAILAFVDFQGPGALLPGALFRENEEGLHAGL